MNFKDYYSKLETPEKNIIRDSMVPKYMSNSSFYGKVKDNTFTLLELEKLEKITDNKFENDKEY